MDDFRSGAKQAIREHRLYDYVANHYYEASKEDLKDLCLEILYLATERLSEEDEEVFSESLLNELDDRWEDEE